MKVCPKCNSQLADDAMFCTSCGAQLGGSAQEQQPHAQSVQQNQQFNQQTNQQFNQQYNQQTNQNPYYTQPVAPAYDPFDHTAEFDAKDISDNKVFAMAAYLLGLLGIIIALLASHDSKFARFHVNQALKFTIINILIAICSLVLCWTIIVPIAAAVMCLVFFVIEIICFFQVCSGKAKEAPILRSLKFLK